MELPINTHYSKSSQNLLSAQCQNRRSYLGQNNLVQDTASSENCFLMYRFSNIAKFCEHLYGLTDDEVL